MKGNSEFASGENFDDLLFENRHKAYGAYQLRKSYERRLTLSALTTAGVFILSLLAFQFTSEAESPESSRPRIDDITTIVCPTVENIVIVDPDVPKGGAIPESEVDPAYYRPVEEEIVTPPPAPDNIGSPDLSGLTPTVPGPYSGPIGLPGGTPDGSTVLTVRKHNPAIFETRKEDKIEEFADTDPYLKDYDVFLRQHLRYPEAAASVGLEGSVILKFVVEKDGSISQVDVVKSLGMGCTEEAKRVLAKMPRWSPGTIDGHPVRVAYQITVNFLLDK